MNVINQGLFSQSYQPVHHIMMNTHHLYSNVKALNEGSKRYFEQHSDFMRLNTGQLKINIMCCQYIFQQKTFLSISFSNTTLCATELVGRGDNEFFVWEIAA